jgi:phosphatidylcholine synthase
VTKELNALSLLIRARAFTVHVFTAVGAALALAALICAAANRWTEMFLYLGIALIVDGVDGTIARYVRVTEVLPRWSGDVLDLVVDFITYVFVPAYAIAASNMLPVPLAMPAGAVIVITGALYFADRDMKFSDNYFRGFPALWNVATFYLFLLRPQPWLATAIVGILAVFTFVPFKFLHPMRVKRHRSANIAALAIWSALAVLALQRDLEPGPWVIGGLLLVAVYFAGIGWIEKMR